MAINPTDVSCDKNVTISRSSLNRYVHGNSPASRLVKLDYAPKGSILPSLSYKHRNNKNNNLEFKSPYLKNSNYPFLGDKFQLLSRVTEKRFVHKNGNMMSSFPLVGNIYKANSDEFKARQPNKKVVKSVLTLPNDSDPARQLCTVSDMNDSEDVVKKTKKRNTHHVRRIRSRCKGLESESQYCSDTDFHLERSSTDVIKKCGDGRIRKTTAESKSNVKEKVKPHDVWAVLRNMNRFQFQTSPHLSEDSFNVGRQKKNPKRRNNRKDMRVFETRRTEEIAYISSYKVEKSSSLSRCSSFDKVTVIDKKQVPKVGKEIEDKPKKRKIGKFLGPRALKGSPKNKTSSVKRNNLKAITYVYPTKNGDIDNTEKVSSFAPTTPLPSPNYGKLKDPLNINASDDLGYESKTTENDEDCTSFEINTIYTTQASQYSQSKLSDNSGSSKAAAFTKHILHTKKVKPKPKIAPDKHNNINGITKVILNRTQNVEHPQQQNTIDIPKINIVHQATMIPSSSIGLPKLTKTEINRQLQKYKFPVVILGKDQLRSSMHVVYAENPQFDGLDQQIWPFMRSWYGIDQPVKVMKQVNHNVFNKKTKIDEFEKRRLSRNNAPKPTQVPKIERREAPMPLSEIINENQRKLKPIKQFKDRMLKLLYKNSSVINVIDGSPSSGKNENHSIADFCTDTQDKCDTNNSKVKVKKSMIPISLERRPWAKAKWASDFIENIIKKVKSGAYYNQDGINNVYNETVAFEKKEVDIQTDSNSDVISNANGDKSIQQIAIPGFDDARLALEIKTMSTNEVAVKHCGTNIMVYFDVTVPTNSIVGVKRDSTFIPIDITKSLTKVFKCQTSILNAMLPAELCSILPNVLRDIVNSRQHLAFSTMLIDTSCLNTISEVPVISESLAYVPTPTLAGPALLPLMPMALKLRQLLNGYFKKDDITTAKFHVVTNTSCLVKNRGQLAEELSVHKERIHLFDIQSHLMMPLIVTYQSEAKILPIATVKSIQPINTCKVLQVYTAPNQKPISMSRPFSLMNLLETMATYLNNIGQTCFKMLKTDNNLAFNTNMGRSLGAPNMLTFRIGSLKIDSLTDCSQCSVSSKICILPDTDKALEATSKSFGVELSAPNVKPLEKDGKKVSRKGFVKFYRKCKSSSNRCREKVTRLSRITNLEAFFHALGSAKHGLSGVFDGVSGNKIMSSINELKNWTAEINPRQALLVILLANKKETPNLLRYHPMLLQGIAVKRITKAIELDMEIEVIERENLDGVSRFEGISYLPASIENQDSLYEELCWIAKNTASDYQRPFDHTSEKLLKSLLEKRKKLNPSYLRVMARYVGLGLLKSPGKREQG